MRYHFFRLFIGNKTQKLFISHALTKAECVLLYCFARKIETISESEFFN